MTLKLGSTRSPRGGGIFHFALSLAFILTLSACSGSGEGQFRPHPPRTATSELTKPQEQKESPSETDALQSETVAPPTEANPDPTFLYPNGQEVTLTPPGTVLNFGETATISTTDTEGRFLVWGVSMHDQVVVPAEDVTLVDPDQYEGTTSFACFAYDITFIGAVSRSTADPMVLSGIPDIAHAAVAAPVFLPGNTDHRTTTHVEGGVDNACGIPETSRLPTNEAELATNFPYARGTLGVIRDGNESDNPATVIHEVNGNPDRTFHWQ